MIPTFDLKETAEAIGGRYLPSRRGSDSARGVTTDSRGRVKGSLFVALKGDNFDGHDFAIAALDSGAAAVMISNPSMVFLVKDAAFILVEDTLEALQKMAAWHRRAMKKLKVIAVTGSNGKTTVKELIAAAVGQTLPVLKTEGNLNNHIGLPLTLLKVSKKDRVAVVEMGMNHKGEIALLTEIAAPDVGLITNVGAAHIGHFKSVKKIAEAKGELVDGMPEGSIAILNADDPNSSSIIDKKRDDQVIKKFGRNPSADFNIVDSWRSGRYGRKVAIVEDKSERIVKTKLFGLAQAENVAAAYAAARTVGVSSAKIANGIARVKATVGRMAPLNLPNGALLIDDTYNANPDSTKAALLSVAEEANGRRAIFVIGDMKELGDRGAAAHKKIGALAASLGFSVVVGVGALARLAIESAKKSGVKGYTAKSQQAAANYIAKMIDSDDILLVKGSRGSSMEKFIGSLLGKMEEQG